MTVLRFAVAFCCTLIGQLAIATPVQSAEARRIAEPLVKPAFTPLPPGAIEPAGWLRDWALAARNGITGHLDEWSPTYRDAWKGVQPGAPGDGTGWPLEQCSYWLDGALRLGYVLHDDALIKKVTDRLNLVVNGVNNGGNSFIYWKKEPPDGLQQLGLLAHGARPGGLVRSVGRQTHPGCPGSRLFPLPRAARGNQVRRRQRAVQYRRDAGNLCLQRRSPRARSGVGRGQVAGRRCNLPRLGRCAATTRAMPYAPTKNSACRSCSIPGPASNDTGRPRIAPCSGSSDNNMLPYGVASGMENLAGIGAFRLTETCDVTADIWSSAWMYRIEGERSFGDGIERAFFNAAPAPIARDFQTMCYYQSPNRIESASLPEEQPKAPGRGGLKFTRLGYPHVLCCVGACNRIIPNLHHSHVDGHPRQGTGGDALRSLHGVGPGRRQRAGEVDVPNDVSVRGDDPRYGRSRADGDLSALFPHSRPGATDAQIAVNGSAADATPDAKRLRPHRTAMEQGRHRRTGLSDDRPVCSRLRNRVSVDVPTSTSTTNPTRCSRSGGSLTKAFRTVRCCSPCRSPTRIRTPAWRMRSGSMRWTLTPSSVAAEVKVERRPMPAKWDWPLDAPLTITLPAKTFDWKPSDIQALPAEPVKGIAAETIRLVPTAARSSAFRCFP